MTIFACTNGNWHKSENEGPTNSRAAYTSKCSIRIKVNYWDQQRDLIYKNSLHHSIVPAVCLCTTGLDLWRYGVGKNQFLLQLLHRRWKDFVKNLHLMNSSWFETWMKRDCSLKSCPGQLICIPMRIVHHLRIKGMSGKDRLIVLILHWCLWLIESCSDNYGEFKEPSMFSH